MTVSNFGGFCDPRFARVQELLIRSVEEGGEVGASIYVNIDGEDVIDMWAGWKDKDHSAAWDESTIVNVFSASKTVTSLAVLMLVDRGRLKLDAPVADYWPEFAQNGKERALVRHLISHTVGLPAWDPPFSMAQAMDIESATTRLAAQVPWWEPGTRGSYHASSFGHLAGELVRRVTGEPLSRFITREIAGPLQADFYLGLTDDQFDQVATVYPPPGDDPSLNANGDAAPPAADDPIATERAIRARTKLGSFSGQKRDPLVLFNSPEWRRTEFGGSTGHANARGLGRIMSALCNDGVSRGVKLLSQGTIDEIFKEQFRGIDGYYLKPIRWGTGYALAPTQTRERGPLPFLRPSKRTCYWYGTGGSLSIADVERRLTLTYTMNQCQSGRHSLNGLYYNAIYDSL